MSKKQIILSITTIALLVIVSFFVVTFLKEKKSSNRFTINTNQDFLIASNYLKQKKFEEAENIFSSLENNPTISMQDLAFLKLKKLQISLAKNDYQDSVRILEEIITDQRFPKETKGRAIENVLTSYLKNNRDPSFYSALFSQGKFTSLKKNSPLESIYAFAEYGYQFQPTTILGANVLYSKIDKAQQIKDKESIEYRASLGEISDFSKNFFTESEKEVKSLLVQRFQEIALINIFSERSRVIKKLSRLGVETPTGLSMEKELTNALEQANILGEDFYLFYTAFNYIDYISANKKEVDQKMIGIIERRDVFSKSKVTKEWLSLVSSVPVSTTTKDRIRLYNPTLVETIENIK